MYFGLQPGKVAVVIHDDPSQAQALSRLLANEGLEARSFNSVVKALADMPTEHPPILIVTALHLPEIDGWGVCRLLRSPEYKAFNRLPIIVISTTYAGEEAARIATDLGANALVSSPVNAQEFGKTIRQLLQGQIRQQSLRLLIVEANDKLAVEMHEVFSQHGYQADRAGTGDEARIKFQAAPYDLVVLDHHLPDIDGNELLIQLKTLCPSTVHIAMTFDDNPARALDWMRRGAAAYVRKPFAISHLIELCAKVLREKGMLRVEAQLDLRTRELQESESRYRMILQSAADGFWRSDCHGQLLDVNEAYCRMSGFDKAALVRMRISDLEAVENATDTTTHIEKVRTRGVDRFETRHRRRDGSVYDVEVSVQYLPEAGGQMISFLRDITERKQAEATRQESEARLRLVLEANTLGIWDWNMLTGELVWSVEQAQLFGLKLGEFDGRYATFATRVHPDDLAGVEDEIMRSREERRPYRRDYRVIWPDGSVHWLSGRGHFLRNASGRPVRMVGVTSEITERKQLEIERQKFFLLAESSSEFIGMCDLDMNPLYVNPAGQRMVGLPDMATACRIKVQDYYFPEDKRFIAEEFFPRVLREGHGDVEIRLRHFQTGEPIWMYYHLFCVHDANSTPVGWATVSHDITERKMAEAEREKLHAQLLQAQKMEAVGQLAGGVAHDFNNILSVMMMYLTLMEGNPNADSDMLDSLKALETEARRAANLTRQLLLFSRRTAMQVKPIELNEIIQGMVKMLSRIIGEHIKIEFKASVNEAWIEADSGMIEQVVMNLAVNARDAMPKGGNLTLVTGNAEVVAETINQYPDARPGCFVCLTVKDTGCGMEASTLQRIFEPFFTTKEAGKGTGLGLATVHGIVKQHSGWIEVDSVPGQGSEFRVFFPPYDKGFDNTIQDKVILKTPRGTETILLAEDEAPLRHAFALSLRSLGYVVIEAANGREALKHWNLHKSHVQMLFTDMVLPEGMSGQELAALCRAENPNLKIIISSGYSTEHSITGGETAEGIVFLPKPCEPHEMARVIRESLDKKT